MHINGLRRHELMVALQEVGLNYYLTSASMFIVSLAFGPGPL